LVGIGQHLLFAPQPQQWHNAYFELQGLWQRGYPFPEGKHSVRPSRGPSGSMAAGTREAAQRRRCLPRKRTSERDLWPYSRPCPRPRSEFRPTIPIGPAASGTAFSASCLRRGSHRPDGDRRPRTGDLRLGIHCRGPGPGDTASLPYFTVDDLPATLQRVRELGGSVIHPGDRWAVSRESGGSPFALTPAPACAE
jgi:hypothetical protein